MPRPEHFDLREVITTFLLEHFRSITGALLLVLMAASVHMGLQWLQDPYRFPLQIVKIEGKYRYLDQTRLQAVVEPHVNGGFFAVDVSVVCDAVEAMPWVAAATVRRNWPDGLTVLVTEQVPVARWGEDGYLNGNGELFLPVVPVAVELPALAGPAEHEVVVLEQYRLVSRTLASLGLQVAGISQDERRAWRVVIENGIELELGRADTVQRLQRFVHAWPVVFADHVDELQRIDLRYSNGFSVRWQQANAKADNSKG